MSTIPVIDLFAGPGGLGEGFSALIGENGKPRFRIALSIEKDQHAHQTLELRAFFREFDRSNVPDEYYAYLHSDISREDLFGLYPEQAEHAKEQAWCAELGATPVTKIDKRITESLGKAKQHDRWLLIGGPPCQAYSFIGRSRYAKVWKEHPEKKDRDRRHFLYLEYLRILAAHQPPVFIMENVHGLLSSSTSNGKISEQIFSDLRKPCRAFGGLHNRAEYRLYSFMRKPRKGASQKKIYPHPEDFIVQCEKIGLPQARHRLIILGIRSDLDIGPETLDVENTPVTLHSVIHDLPKIRSGLSKEADSSEAWLFAVRGILTDKILDARIEQSVRDEVRKQADRLPQHLPLGNSFIKLKGIHGSSFKADWFNDERIGGVCNHESRAHIAEDLQRYFFAACFAKVKGYSPQLKDFPEQLLPNHKNAVAGVNDNQFADRFRVQLYERPSTTITSHIGKDGHYYIHPDPLQCRSLTVREAARLQTFPDNYFFIGSRTSQYWQVGNAVPPLLAYKLANKVYDLFKNAKLA